MSVGNIPAIEGIDTEKGLMHSAGREELYLKIMRNFYQRYRTFDEEFSAVEHESRVLLVHSLKSLAGTIGATRLNSEAQKMEHACQQQSDDIDVIAEAFFRELNAVLDVLKNI